MPTQYETKQVFYNSKDGTRVPMFLTYKKGLKLDGQNPTLLYAYGGFDISLTPAFSVPNRGVAGDGRHLRAAESCAAAANTARTGIWPARSAKKQNVFDDFIAAAEWLIANKYTSTPKLAIRGGSNGGLLIGACVTQRPDLFGATLPDVGVMDMLRFQKFTIGWAWTSRLRIVGQCGGFQGSLRLFAAAQHEAGDEVSADVDCDGRSRRPRGAGTQLQVRGDHAGGSGGPAPVLIRIRDQGGARGGKADFEDHRGDGGRMGVRGAQSEYEGGAAVDNENESHLLA